MNSKFTIRQHSVFTNQFTVARRADNMAHLSNEELADMHLAYGAANGNAREAARLYQERFPNRYLAGHRMFMAIHRRLREHGSFNVNRRAYDRPRPVREVIEDF